MSELRVNLISTLTGDLVSPLSGRATAEFYFPVVASVVGTVTGSNIASVVRNATGKYRVTWSTAYASAVYMPVLQVYMIDGVTTANVSAHIYDIQPGFIQFTVRNGVGTNMDPTGVIGIVHGDLA